MTDEKLLQVIDELEKLAPTAPWGYGLDQPDASHGEHVLSMFPRLRVLVAEGRREKAMRWIGFIQGALWAWGEADLETLKRMNMADGVEYDAERDK